ncbi:MAG: ABC transporter permease [Bacteroidetes bacterium]|nr:ABC transporter permease [Bacteroidota bacterium]
MNLPFYISRRYLFSKKSHNAINIVTGISVACVAVVTAALIIILSAMNGLSDLVESLYNTFHADVRITSVKGKTMVLDSLQIGELKKIPGVAWYEEIVDENVLVENDNRQLIVTMRGVSETFAKNTRFDTTIHRRQGRYDLHPLGGEIGTVVGQEIASRLDLGKYSILTIYVPKRDRNLTVDLSNLGDQIFNDTMARVTGNYSVSSDFDGKYIFLPINVVRGLIDYKKESTSVELGLKKDADAEKVLAAVKKVVGSKYLVQNRYQQNEILFETLKSEKAWTFIILLFVLLIATFNTIGSLTLLIIEKKKDIGILWSMGTDIGMIRRIFFVEGLLISITGTVAGAFLGWLLVFLQRHFGFIHFSKGFVVDIYPVVLHYKDLFLIILSVTAIGLVAAWYPVRVYTKKYQSVKFSG